MKVPPAQVVLSWPPPNYANADRTDPVGIIVAVIVIAIVTFLLAIRIYTRRTITLGFGLDDVLIIIAYVPALAFTTTGLIAQYRYGWGTDVWDLPPDRFAGSLKSALASFMFFDLATSFTKLSMLALIYRLAIGASKALRYTVIALMVCILTNCILFMLVLLLQCRPLKLYWTVSLGPQNCIDEAIHLLIAGIVNTTTDFIVVVLPLTIVTRLQGAERNISRRQAIIVNTLFAAGFLACAAGAVRTYFTWQMTSSPDYNITRRAWPSWLASSMELYIGIMAASVPATKPFFAKHLPSLLGASARSMARSRAEGKAGSRSSVDKGAAAPDALPTIHEVDEKPDGKGVTEITKPRKVQFSVNTEKSQMRTARGLSTILSPIELDLDDDVERSAGRDSPGSDVFAGKPTEGRSMV